MLRQSLIDVEAVKTKIRDTILNYPVALSRRMIFDLCRFDNENKALLPLFRSLHQQPRRATIDCEARRPQDSDIYRPKPP